MAEQSIASEERTQDSRLGKRLAYILRYGAEKAGLTVSSTGFVAMTDLLETGAMRYYSVKDVLREVDLSYTNTGKKRFEVKEEGGHTSIRAVYGRRMERNPNHEGCMVPRLLATCTNYVAAHITQYDLQDFPDEFLLQSIIHRLRQTQKLNNKAFNSILGPGLDSLDLWGTAMVTQNTLKLIADRCPHLKHLSLRDCSYATNDHIMEKFLKKLPELETLNLSGCGHLSDRTISTVIKHCPNITSLNLTKVPDISQQTILRLVTSCSKLENLDIIDNKHMTSEGKATLGDIMLERDINVTLKDFSEVKLQDECCMTASVGW